MTTEGTDPTTTRLICRLRITALDLRRRAPQTAAGLVPDVQRLLTQDPDNTPTERDTPAHLDRS